MLRTVLVIFLGLLPWLTYSQAPMNSKFLALGDSYTIGESVAENERWPVQLAKALNDAGQKIDPPRIIATTGWRCDQLKQAILDARLSNDWGMVSLLIGVNNQYQGRTVESYAPEFEELLKMAVTLAGGKKENVFVVSIPDYGYTPFGKPKQEQITKAINAYNTVNRTITAKMGIKYVNITDLTQEGLAKPNYVAADGLHPSGEMYSRWVERILLALTPRR